MPFQPSSLIVIQAQTIQEHSVRHSHSTTQGFLNPHCHCPVPYQIHSLPPSRLRYRLDYPSPHSSEANFLCLECFQVSYPHQVRHDGIHFIWSGGHCILLSFLQGCPLQTKMVEQVIFATIQMQPHHHAEGLTRMLWWSSKLLRCILRLSFVHFERKIPSV